MTAATYATPLDRAKRTAEIAQWLALVVIIVMALNVIWNYGSATLEELEQVRGGTPAAQVNAVLVGLIWIWAPLLLIDALCHLRVALRAYAGGNFFGAESAKAVRRAGEQAVYGLIVHAVAAPTLFNWTQGRFGEIALKFESTDLAMLAFAVFVAAIGRVMDIAIAVKAENDEII